MLITCLVVGSSPTGGTFDCRKEWFCKTMTFTVSTYISDIPYLRSQWDVSKNSADMSTTTTGSNMRVWWICDKGHSWQATVKNRYNKGSYSQCPFCSGRHAIKGINDLCTVNPELAMQWDESKNTSHPSQFRPMSNTQAWWICDKGHSWKAKISSRSKGHGCPYCTNRKVLYGFNDVILPALTDGASYPHPTSSTHDCRHES